MRFALILCWAVPASAQLGVNQAEAALKRGDLNGARAGAIGPAQSGNAKAQFIIGMVEANRGRDRVARDWWLSSAKGGYGDAFTGLGFFALSGRGDEPRSSQSAARYFGQGAAAGSAQGMLYLSRLLMIGEGIAQDRRSAAEWRQRAAAAGDPDAEAMVKGGANKDGPAIVDVATWLGNVNRTEQGVAILQSEARAGNVAAMVVLGTLYYNGQAGGGRDYERARQWWENAGNNSVALYRLGELYMYGRGVHSNWGRAEQYFAAAAKYGHPDGARMAAAARDLHFPAVSPDSAQRDFAGFCSSRGGSAIGVGCYRNGETILVQ